MKYRLALKAPESMPSYEGMAGCWEAVDALLELASLHGDLPTIDVKIEEHDQGVLMVDLCGLSSRQCVILDESLRLAQDAVWLSGVRPAFRPLARVWIALKSFFRALWTFINPRRVDE